MDNNFVFLHFRKTTKVDSFCLTIVVFLSSPAPASIPLLVEKTLKCEASSFLDLFFCKAFRFLFLVTNFTPRSLSKRFSYTFLNMHCFILMVFCLTLMNKCLMPPVSCRYLKNDVSYTIWFWHYVWETL